MKEESGASETEDYEKSLFHDDVVVVVADRQKSKRERERERDRDEERAKCVPEVLGF